MTDTNTNDSATFAANILRIWHAACALGALGCVFVMFYALKVDVLTPLFNLCSGLAMIAIAVVFLIVCKYARTQLEKETNEQKN